MTTCRDPKSQAGSNPEMQELQRMAELLGGMTQADFNQQMSTTTEEAMHARKARSAREASAGVATPVCTSARNNGGEEGKTPSSPTTPGTSAFPTPKALFKEP